MMTSRFLLLAILAVGQCHSFKTADEVVPESMLLAGKFSSMSPQAFIEATTASGGNEADCQDFADTAIATAQTDVNSANAVLAAVDTGATCATEGDSLVTTAQQALDSAQSAEAIAQTNYNDAVTAQSAACSAPVSFEVNLDTLEANSCYTYTSEADYVTVKAACTSATTTTTSTLTTYTAAQGATADATTELADAQAQSAALTSACNCRVQEEQAAAWTAVSADVDARCGEWKKAHEVLCALDHTTTGFANCIEGTDYDSCPALTQPTMAAGVEDEVCVESVAPSTVVGAPSACVPATTCEWFQSNHNTDGEIGIGNYIPVDCIAQCRDRGWELANIHEAGIADLERDLAASCWCQNGDNRDVTSHSWFTCVIEDVCA